MNSLRLPAILLFFLVSCLMMSSCRSKKEVAGVPRNYLNTKFLMGELDENRAGFEWLSGRCKISFKDEDQNISATVNLRMQQDSMLWMSVTPLFGIEIARIVISPDSALVLDRINKEYQVLNFDEIRKFTGVPELTFALLQDLILGNSIVPVSRKFDAQAENGLILLTNHSQRGSEMLWLLPSIFRPSRIHYEDQPNNQKFDLHYSNFKEIGGKHFPQGIRLVLDEPQDLSLDINFTRYIINESQDMPYSIPASYDRKK
ncbi:MAG: DUF4292 domain-containing protein [Bacteroidia bacterium]